MRAMSRNQDRERQARVAEEVAKVLGDETICHLCKVTLATFNDCGAILDERCPGFDRIEAVRAPIVKRIYGL